jgi:hypothetical protein
MRKATMLLAIAFVSLITVSTSKAQDAVKGEWMGEFRNNKFWVSMKSSSGRSSWPFDWSLAFELDNAKELTVARERSDVTPVHFELARDAGTVLFDGLMRNGCGLGDYQFTPNQDYVSDMRTMGYDNLPAEQLLRLAIRDVSRSFVKEMRASGYEGATVDQLVRMRNHNITSGFIKEMNALGQDNLSVDQLVRLRNHEVNASFIQEMKAAGYESLSVDQLVRLRNHEIDPTFIRALGDVGYKTLLVEQLIRMRNHSVTPAFIRQLNDAGYKDLPIEDLVFIRDHGLDVYTTRRARRAR